MRRGDLIITSGLELGGWERRPPLRSRGHGWVDQEGHLTQRSAALMYPSDLILPPVFVFIPGVGDASDDVQGLGEGFEGEMEMTSGEEDIDTFRQESRENNYDMDQGKNAHPAGWTASVRPATYPTRSRLLLPPPCYPQAGVRDLNELRDTSSPKVQLVSSGA